MPARILVVEDESMIAMLLEDLLADLGYTVVSIAATIDAALAALEENRIDLAMVDVNLGGVMSFPVADALKRRGIPFLFTTGYGQTGLSEPYAAEPVLQKPFRSIELKEALRALAKPQPGPA